jgi:hypothetical protein
MSERVFLFRAGKIRETIATARWFLYFGVIYCLVVGGGIVLLGLLLGPKGGPAGLPQWTIAALALPGGLLVWHLIFCSRHRLYLCEEGIASQGALALPEVSFADVVALRWHSEGLGGAVIRTQQNRVGVNLVHYRPDARLRIVGHLQRGIPASSQEDWSLFCLRIALPLVRPDARPYKILLVRTRFDRLCGTLLFCEFAFLLADWHLTGNWKTAAVWCAATGVGWVTTRFFVPEGYRVPSGLFMLLDQPLGQMVDHVALMLRIVGGLCIGIAFLNPRFGGIALSAVFVIAGFDLLFHTARSMLRVWRAFKDRNKEDPEACEAAAREWEALETAAAAPRQENVAARAVGAATG